jgi:hypothetical protein
MASCERCWDEARRREHRDGRLLTEHYYVVMREAEEQAAVCTQDTLEGRIARAGDYWDAERQLDTRTLPLPERAPPGTATRTGIPPAALEAATRTTDTRKDCTCLGTCRGAAGLSYGWRCAMEVSNVG